MYGFIKKLFLGLFWVLYSSTLFAAVVQLNSTGGSTATNGLRIYIDDTTQIQVRRLNNTGQLYSPSVVPTSNTLDNGIYLRANGAMYGPDHFAYSATTDYSSRAVTTVLPATPSQGVTQSTTSSFRVGILGPQVTVVWKYIYPLDYVTAEVTLVIPATYAVSANNPVRYYHAVDTYLGGSDNGCGVRYIDTNGKQVVGTYPLSSGTCPSSNSLPANLDVVESFRERNGKFDHYCVGFWNTFWSSSNSNACAIGKANSLSDSVTTTYQDTGAAIEYDFTAPGTYTFSYDFVVGSTFVPNYDHLEIRHAGTATLCPTEVKVLACTSSTVPCPEDSMISTGALIGNLTFTPSTSTVTVTPSVFEIGSAGPIATETLQASSAATYALSAAGLSKAPLNGVKCWNTTTNSQSCSFTFTNTPCIDKFECMENGLTYNNRIASPSARNPLYTKVTGISFDVDAVAVLTSGAQSTAYTATGVIVDLVNDTAGNCGTTVVASKTVNFLATDSGRKKVTFTNTDVLSSYPSLRCRVRDTNLGKTGCSSDNFSVRPQFLAVTSTNATSSLPVNHNSTPIFKAAKSGNGFNLRAAASDTAYTGTPKIDNAKLAAHAGAPVTGAISSGVFSAATAGVSTGDAFLYTEVGHFKILAQGVYDDTFTAVDIANGDCDNSVSPFDNTGGSGTPKIFGCRVGNTSDTAYFGRFIPDHFKVTAGGNASTQATQACSTFTYFGQDSSTTPGFTTPFTLTAQNGATPNATTQNYTGDYAKFKPAIWSNYQFSATPLSSGSTLMESAANPSVTNWDNSVASWTNGVARILARHRVTRPTARVYPQTITISARPEEEDHSVSSTETVLSSSMAFRFGRLAIDPAHGSELLPLPLRIEAQYWSNNNGFVRSLGDSCTAISPSSIAMKNYKGNLNACETQLSGNPLMNNGVLNMSLSAPKIGGDGKPNTGSVDLEVNLGTAAAGERTCINPVESDATNGSIPWFGDADPTGRASFGIYKAPIIYMRENF